MSLDQGYMDGVSIAHGPWESSIVSISPWAYWKIVHALYDKDPDHHCLLEMITSYCESGNPTDSFEGPFSDDPHWVGS